MLIGGDDIRNEALPLARVFQCLFPLRADWRRSDSSVDGESGNHKGIGGGIDGGNSNSRGVVASSRPFPAPPPERPGELAHRLHVARSTQQSLATRTCCLERSLPNIVTVSALSHSTRVKSVEPLSHETGSTSFSSFFKTLYQRNFSVPTNTWTLIKPLGIRGWHATRKIWTFLKLIHMSVEVNTWLVGSEVWVF